MPKISFLESVANATVSATDFIRSCNDALGGQWGGHSREYETGFKAMKVRASTCHRALKEAQRLLTRIGGKSPCWRVK